MSPMRVGSPCDDTADLAALRRRIAALERRPAALESATDASRVRRPWPLGVDTLDGALPESGLASDGLHEAAGASAADGPAAAAFLAALLARRVHAGERGPVLVCQLTHRSRAACRPNGGSLVSQADGEGKVLLRPACTSRHVARRSA